MTDLAQSGKTAAETFKKVFRTMDIVARLGGDEFTIFASNTNEKQVSYFQAKIDEALDEANSASGKPYKVSISLGCAECRPHSDSTIDDYLRKADAALYELKTAKKRPRASG